MKAKPHVGLIGLTKPPSKLVLRDGALHEWLEFTLNHCKLLFWRRKLQTNHLYRPLLAMIALLAVQSSAQTFIHNTVLFIDTSDHAWYNQIHWLIRTPYLLSNALSLYRATSAACSSTPVFCMRSYKRGVWLLCGFIHTLQYSSIAILVIHVCKF